MVDSAQETQFHWLAGDGTRLSGSERDLRAALASGALSASASVWRAGWAEWLPANRVAELASAIPDANRQSPLKPRRDPSIVTPPATPAERAAATPAERMAAVAPRAPLNAPASAPLSVPLATPRRAAPPTGRTQPPPPPIRAKLSAPPSNVHASTQPGGVAAHPPLGNVHTNTQPGGVAASPSPGAVHASTQPGGVSASPSPGNVRAHTKPGGVAANAPPANTPPANTPPANAPPANARAGALPALGGLPPLSPSLANKPKQDAKPAAPEPHEPARDTLAPSSFGVIGTPRRAQPSPAAARREAVAPVASVAPARGRAPMPTLSEEGTATSATATLRPPGAVPPPARGVPAVPALDSSGSFSFDKRSPAAMTPIPSFGPPGGAFETVPPAGLPPRLAPEPTHPSAPAERAPPEALTPALDEAALPAAALPPVMNKALLAEPAAEPIEPPLDSTLEVVAKVPPEARRTPVEPIRAIRPQLNSASEDVLARALQRHSLVKVGRFAVDSRTIVMALSALCGALLVTVVGLYIARRHTRAPEPALSASALSAPPPPAPAPGCRLLLPAALIAPNIERSVPPYATKVGNEPALALGFAATKTKGVGLRLNPETLDTVPAFEEDGKDVVRGVVPLTRSGSPTFFVDRDDRALRSAHTVDEAPPFTLGVSDAGFSRVVAGSTSLVWPLAAEQKITEPRAAAVGSFGYGVTFRRGGQSGAVLLGFVANDGSKKSELAELPSAPKFLGTPVIAGSAAGALVAFAGRDAPDAAWKVFVSLTPPGAPPSAARELVTGSGGGAISPTLSALAPDRWLVQWTEGVSGQYQVRVQSFAADLSPIGAAVLASPKGANAGQGSLGAYAGGAASLFILTTAGHDELWGATLSCP